MQLITALFLACCLKVSYAQQNILEQKVTITLQNQSIKDALRNVSDQAGCFLNYANSEVDNTRKINKAFDAVPLRDVIQEIWGSNQIKIIANGRTVKIIPTASRSTRAKKGNLRGLIKDEKGAPLPGATILLDGTRTGGFTNSKGEYFLNNIPVGNWQVEASFVGYQKDTKDITIAANKTLIVDFTLQEGVSELDEVLVIGKTKAAQLAEQAITINTVNAQELQGQTQDVAEVLDRVEGVRIRQSGGLGSQTNISINGLTGNSIRFYYNGIPSEFLGGGFELNTLPISNVDRIEVYKGVMPANIGTDALGGGINVATNQSSLKSRDFSYQYGSFNTHRIAGSFTQPLGDKWYVNVNANYNYSDNNYEMEVENNTYAPNLPFPTGTEMIRVRRFHDAFSSFLGHVNAGYLNKEKRLSLKAGVYLTATSREVQHGVRVNIIPFGEMEYKGQDTYLKFDLSKGFSEKWQLNYSGIAGYSRVMITDSSQSVYDWNGNNITSINPAIFRINGAELLGIPSISDVYNYNTVNRVGLTRSFKHNFSIGLHHFFAYQDRRGREELEINYIAGEDPNQTGFQIARNITSLEVQKLLFKQKLELLATLKSFQYTTQGVNTLTRGSGTRSELPIVTSAEQDWGYNTAIKWQFHKKMFLRASYEDALRIPTQTEIFGDLQTIVPNFSLQPERSQNFNAGLKADLSDLIKINLNYFIRSQRNLILLQILDVESARFINQNRVYSSGVELALTGELTKHLSFVWNITHFDIEIRAINQLQDDFLIGKPVPNIPTFFSNLGLTYTLEDIFRQDNTLQFNLDGQFVDEFSFIQEGRVRNDDNWIPTQYAIDAGLTFQLKEKISFNFQANNLLDAALFDVISVPKPGRNFAVKVRYTY
ncbi:MAG: TonB-dependent receptor [Bacteroidota bacterium]